MTAARQTTQPYRFSREQYYQLETLGYFEGKRVERIRGEIVEMSPIGWLHVVSTTKTAAVLSAVFQSVGWVSQGNPIPTDDSDPQPDVMVVPGRIADYSDHPTTALLIVEVSDSTLIRDTTIKAELYASAKIAEFWVVDLEHRQLLVFRDPTPISDGGHSYRTQQVFGTNDNVSPLMMPSATVRVADLLPELQPLQKEDSE